MLTEDQKLSFIKDGYCAFDIDLDPEWARWAIDLTWSQIDDHFDRNDAATWTGEIEDDCFSATIAKRRGRLKYKTNVSRHPELMQRMYSGPIMAAVQSLIGPRAVGRHATRGLYPIFPSPDSRQPVTGGMDGHPFQITATLYLDDVGPEGGEFSVWAGSHEVMAQAFAGPAAWQLLDNSRSLMRECEACFDHVALPGPRGRVILWHHRVLHAPMSNHSERVRYALLADYHRDDWLDRQHLPHGQDFWDGWAVSDLARRHARTDGIAA